MDLLLLVAVIFQTVACAPEAVFAPEGNSITLLMNRHDALDADYAVWVFDKTNIITYYPHYPDNRQLRIWPSYKSRVEFDTRDLSMELKNLTKTDMGIYTGEMETAQDKLVVEYKLHVLEAVEKPVLTAHLNWSSGDECQVMVMCRAGDLSVTSSCNISTCTQDGDSTHGGLSIFTRHGSIICNHSNPVSWSQDAVDIGDLCSSLQGEGSLFDDDEQTTPIISWPIAGVICFAAVLIVAAILAAVFRVLGYWKDIKKQELQANDEIREKEEKEPSTPLLSKKHLSWSSCFKTTSSAGSTQKCNEHQTPDHLTNTDISMGPRSNVRRALFN